jgi:polyisoprenoid-binding protein YceI
MADTTAAAPATHTVDGLDVPTAGTFTIDPSHSQVGFAVRHVMVSKVRGRFTAFTGTITVGDDPVDSSVEADIEVASIDTHDTGRDDHLRSADFFDAAAHPTATFRSTRVTAAKKGRFTVLGDLTIRGVTNPVELDVEYEGVAQDPWGNQRIGVSATTEIDREAFGLTWNQALETGGVLVGKTVKVEIEAEINRRADA